MKQKLNQLFSFVPLDSLPTFIQLSHDSFSFFIQLSELFLFATLDSFPFFVQLTNCGIQCNFIFI